MVEADHHGGDIAQRVPGQPATPLPIMDMCVSSVCLASAGISEGDLLFIRSICGSKCPALWRGRVGGGDLGVCGG